MGDPTIDHGARLLAIYDDAVGEVFAYLRVRCGNRALAEDLTADPSSPPWARSGAAASTR